MVKKKYSFINFLFSLTFILGCNTPQELTIVSCKELYEINKIYYLNNDLFNGKCETYDIDVLIEEKFFKQGKEEKNIGYYYPSGNIKFVGFMKNDSVNGKFVQYHENGKVKFKGQFIMGYPDGKWLGYDSLGNKVSTQNFKKGNLILEKK